MRGEQFDESEYISSTMDENIIILVYEYVCEGNKCKRMETNIVPEKKRVFYYVMSPQCNHKMANIAIVQVFIHSRAITIDGTK